MRGVYTCKGGGGAGGGGGGGEGGGKRRGWEEEKKEGRQQHTVYKMVYTNMFIPYLYNCFAASRSALPLLPVWAGEQTTNSKTLCKAYRYICTVIEAYALANGRGHSVC